MGAGVWFWILFVVFVILGLFFSWPYDTNAPGARFRPFGFGVVVLILIGLLGWGVFGPPIR